MKDGRNGPFSQIETRIAKTTAKGANLSENAPHFSSPTFQISQCRSQIPPIFGQKPICENDPISCILEPTNRPKQRAQSQKKPPSFIRNDKRQALIFPLYRDCRGTCPVDGTEMCALSACRFVLLQIAEALAR